MSIFYIEDNTSQPWIMLIEHLGKRGLLLNVEVTTEKEVKSLLEIIGNGKF